MTQTLFWRQGKSIDTTVKASMLPWPRSNTRRNIRLTHKRTYSRAGGSSRPTNAGRWNAPKLPWYNHFKKETAPRNTIEFSHVTNVEWMGPCPAHEGTHRDP